MKIHQRLTALGGTLVLSITLAACGGGMEDMPGMEGSSSSSSSPAESSTGSVSETFNEADVSFAQGMIIHHRGALAMAELATTKAQTPEVQALAQRIADAQGPEIDTMTSFLETWGAEVPQGMEMSGMGDMEGMDMGGMDMEESMNQLESASGTDFDRMFLEMMVEHHSGAVEMAKTEQTDGENPEALELAATIEMDQTAEIEEMQQLLQTL